MPIVGLLSHLLKASFKMSSIEAKPESPAFATVEFQHNRLISASIISPMPVSVRYPVGSLGQAIIILARSSWRGLPFYYY